MHDTRVWRNLIGQACCKLYPDWWGGCICIGLSLSLRPRPVIQYHIEFFHSPCPGQIGGRLCQLPVLTVSVKLFRASTRRVLPTTMSDWTANIFSFFQTNVEIKRELRYCDGFKCKSIYFIPQVCVRVVIFWIWTLMSGKTPGQLESVPGVRLLPVRPPGLRGSVHRGQHRLGVPRQQNSPPR